jgi:hypothetical protein
VKTSSLKVALAASFILAACSTSPQGRKQISVPLPVSEVYSDADMRLQLATASSIDIPCKDDECTCNLDFDNQVQMVGYRLALAAYDAYPDLNKIFSEFQVEIAEKSELGSASNAGGKIVIYRGVQKLGLDDAGVAFVLAREMGHVIAQHHAENSGTRILLSIAAGVLFPALNLFNAAQVAQATQVTSAATLGSTVAGTATSYVGSKVIMAGLKPEQLSEADAIALTLLDKEGWHVRDVAEALSHVPVTPGVSGWGEDFRVSTVHVQKMDSENRAMDLGMQAGPIDLQLEAMAEPDAPVVPVDDAPAVQEIAQVETMPVEVMPAPLPVVNLPIASATEVQASAQVETPQAAPVDHERVKLQHSSSLVAVSSKTGKKTAASKKPLKPKVGKVAVKKKQPLPRIAANGKTITKGGAANPPQSKAKATPHKKAPKVKKHPNA